MNKFYSIRYLLCFAISLLGPIQLHAHVAICNQLSLPDHVKKIPFRHGYNTSLSQTAVQHSAQDILVAEGKDVVIEGKFTYGTFSKDLEDEVIEVWIDDCSGTLLRLGEVITNGDGRSKLIVAAANFQGTGAFQIYQRVVGDGTYIVSTLRILPSKTKLVVFDIDGTLTLSDDELWSNIFDENYEPIARAGADALTQFWYRTNYEIIYLSGRHYLLTGRSRQWLAKGGYAEGTLIMAQSFGEVWPSRGGVGEYKRKYLQYLQDSGFVIEAAYGNSKTDIYAYEKVNIAKSTTFIVGKHGGEEKTIVLGEDFLSHLAKLD